MRSIAGLRGSYCRMPSLAQAAQYSQHQGHSTAPQSRSRSLAAVASARPKKSEGSEAAGTSSVEDGIPSTSTSYPHVPVLLNEILQSFKGMRLQHYLDCTLGAGGHAVSLATEHPEMQALLGIDLDPTAHATASQRIAALGRGEELGVHLMRGNYGNLERLMKGLPETAQYYGQLDGIVMDLGVSSMQIDTAERGFSFLRDGPLDMRMDPTASSSAQEIVNTFSETELGRIIRDYGEEKLWRVVARRIVEAREAAPLLTTQQLVQAIGQTQLRSSKGKGQKGIHPATRTFQALRIAVNNELQQLEQALPNAITALRPGGRLAVISFHSLEDRIVKHAFLRACGRPTPDDEHRTYGPDKYAFLDELDASKVAKQVTRKPLEALEVEIKGNPRSRSAKLRVVEKL